MKKFAAFGLAVVALVACASTTQPSLLNPDPVHGGDCHNGDQLCHLCPPKADGTREECHWEDGQHSCSYFTHECIYTPPDPIGPIGAKRDAGARD